MMPFHIRPTSKVTPVPTGLAMDLADMCEELGRVDEVSFVKESKRDGEPVRAHFTVRFKEGLREYRVQVSQVKSRKKA